MAVGRDKKLQEQNGDCWGCLVTDTEQGCIRARHVKMGTKAMVMRKEELRIKSI